jgi:hypothetical protein
MRDVGIHFAWIWLASDRWEQSTFRSSSATRPTTGAQEQDNPQNNPPEVKADARSSGLQQALAL